MNPHPDFVRKKFTPMREKTLKNALAQRLRKEFPRLGGDRILQLKRRADPGSRRATPAASGISPPWSSRVDGRQP
jgi:hypothetical protein